MHTFYLYYLPYNSRELFNTLLLFPRKNVTISPKHSKAKTLLFAYSLNGYEGQLHKQHNRLWEISLAAEKPYRYFYMVDGDSFVPECPLQELNCFTSKICLFEPSM